MFDILRCPLDPLRRTRLTREADRLVCSTCGTGFLFRDGFPVLVVEEAELPAGCDNLDQLAEKHTAAPDLRR
jgi:uncharacterized protein YbaR (Trm112 family)